MTYQEYIFYYKTSQIEKYLIKLSCNYPPPFKESGFIEGVASLRNSIFKIGEINVKS